MEDSLLTLRKILNEQRLNAALISDVANIFYLSGFSGFSPHERDGFLFITKTHAYLLTNSLYITAVKKHVTGMTICEITSETTLLGWLEQLAKKHHIETVGFEDTNLTVAEYKRISPFFRKKKPLMIEDLRIYKNANERALIESACQIGDKAFTALQKKIKVSMSEKDIVYELEQIIRNEASEISFPTIVAIDENAAVPHHTPGETKVKKNSLILLDFGVKYNNYCSDMTRTIFFGEPTVEQKRIYKTVLEAQQQAAIHISQTLKEKKNSLIASDVDAVAREYISSLGLPAFPHSLGHGIGIEVHESPSLSPRCDEELTDRMVFSVEPGIYLPGNFGVRIEDLYVIDRKKLRQLTKSSKDLIVL